MTHVAKFTGGPLDGTSQVRPEDRASAFVLTADHGLLWVGRPGLPVKSLGTYAYATDSQTSDRTIVVYEWRDDSTSPDTASAPAGVRINALMDRLVAVARRNEEAAEPITVYEPTGGPGKEPAWRIGYRDRVSVSRRVATAPTLEAALEAWLTDFE